MRTREVLLFTGFVLACTVLTGCASLGASEDQENEGREEEQTTVLVDNQHEDPIVIYAVRSGQRHRLGRVSPFREEVLELSPTLVSRNGTALQFLVDYLGTSRPPVTREIIVYPGDQVELTVPP